jgi:hypothetical protein
MKLLLSFSGVGVGFTKNRISKLAAFVMSREAKLLANIGGRL